MLDWRNDNLKVLRSSIYIANGLIIQTVFIQQEVFQTDC